MDDETILDVDMDIYDQEEIYPNCTVQVLTNTVTGKVSVGWWRNDIEVEAQQTATNSGTEG